MPDTIQGKDTNDLTLYVEGKEVIVDSARFMRTMDTCADALNISMPWFPGDDIELDRVTKPFSYSKTELYLGGKFAMEGVLYNSTHKLEKDGISKDLEIYSKTADIIDSSVVPPYQATNITLKDRCKQQAEPLKIDVLVGEGVDLTQERRNFVPIYDPLRPNRVIPFYMLGIRNIAVLRPMTHDVGMVQNKPTSFKVTKTREEVKFTLVNAEQTDNMFDHLKKLAAQVGVLLSCTSHGDLLLIKPNVNAKPIGTIDETQPAGDTEKFEIHFKGRDRFARYRAIATSSKHSRFAKSGTAKDDMVKAPRILTIRADDSIPGEAVNAAEWRKNKAAADALHIPFPVNTWYGPDGKLWSPNTTINVISPTIGVKDGFTFLISQVEFLYGKNGCTAVLQLRPPSAYTTGILTEPWK